MRLRKSVPWREGPSAPYDAIYSIGADCGCAMWLRKCHLRLNSGPLDWVRSDSGVLGRVALIESRFAGWLQEKNLVLLGEDTRTRIYRDTALGVEFLHDFPTRIAFPDALRTAQVRYRRRQGSPSRMRCARRRCVIAAAKNVSSKPSGRPRAPFWYGSTPSPPPRRRSSARSFAACAPVWGRTWSFWRSSTRLTSHPTRHAAPPRRRASGSFG